MSVVNNSVKKDSLIDNNTAIANLLIIIYREEVKYYKDKQRNKQEICSKIIIRSIWDKILLQDLQRILSILKLLYYLDIY